MKKSTWNIMKSCKLWWNFWGFGTWGAFHWILWFNDFYSDSNVFAELGWYDLWTYPWDGHPKQKNSEKFLLNAVISSIHLQKLLDTPPPTNCCCFHKRVLIHLQNLTTPINEIPQIFPPIKIYALDFIFILPHAKQRESLHRIVLDAINKKFHSRSKCL